MSKTDRRLPQTRPSRSVRNRTLAILAFLIPVVAYNACGTGGGTGSSTKKLTGQVLALLPTSATIGSGDSFQIVATGGTPPYHYAKQTGGGSVTLDGKYYSTAEIGGMAGSTTYATIAVGDSAGAVAYITIKIVVGGPATLPDDPTALTFTWSPIPVRGAGSIVVIGANGTPPYTFSLSQGYATISGNVISVSNLTQTLIVKITDAVGTTTELPIAITAN